jgi:hypothetical protein
MRYGGELGKNSGVAYPGKPYQLNRIVRCIGFAESGLLNTDTVIRLVSAGSLNPRGSYLESGATETHTHARSEIERGRGRGEGGNGGGRGEER